MKIDVPKSHSVRQQRKVVVTSIATDRPASAVIKCPVIPSRGQTTKAAQDLLEGDPGPPAPGAPVWTLKGLHVLKEVGAEEAAQPDKTLTFDLADVRRSHPEAVVAFRVFELESELGGWVEDSTEGCQARASKPHNSRRGALGCGSAHRRNAPD